MINEKHHKWLVWLVALLCAGGTLLLFEHELLWKLQELNLWLGSWHFLRQQMVVPGGLLMWLGTFFTQFFFYPWLGVALWCAWSLLLMWLTKRTFHIPDRWAVVTLVPVALLLITIVDLGYWIYLLKLPGHCFDATIGTTAVVALVWAYRSLPDKVYLRTAFIAFTCVIAYPLLGVYALAAVVLMGLLSVASHPSSLITAVIAAFAIPLLYYRFVYYETSMWNMFRAGLPLYTVSESHLVYYVPYILLGAFYVALCFADLFRNSLSLSSQHAVPSLVGRVGRAAVLLLIALAVYLNWFKDENFHRELVMEHAIARLDWQGVLDEAAAQKDEPTRAIVVMRNLALARLGRQGNEMFSYRNGSKRYRAPFTMRLLIVAGPLIYYHYGLPNYSMRVSMEMGVEFGWRAEYYKYMARCAVLTGEEQLARKYLGILRQTLFYGRWAENVGKLIGHDELVTANPEMAFITHMMHHDDRLTSDQGFVERFLMQRLAESTYKDDPVFQEQTLLASLWTKDVKRFWQHFIDYVLLHPNAPLPKHYQEAALLYGSLEGRQMDDWPIDAVVRESYRQFREVTPRFENQEIGPVRKALYPLFGNTFFYDYYLMNNLPQW